MTPRIEPVDIDAVPPDIAASLRRYSLSEQGIDNIYLYLLKHPRLFDAWSSFGGAFYTGVLPPRDRELAVLRIQHRSGDMYDWHHHATVARHTGIEQEAIDRVREDELTSWSAHERALLAAVDDLHVASEISDANWTVLSGTYGDEQLIELTLLVGYYLGLAFAMRSLRVPLEPGTEEVAS
jgi:4-carboxymuconolactone decarboxylase